MASDSVHILVADDHTRGQMLSMVWDRRDGSGSRTADSHGRSIRTVHGVGQAFGEPA